MLVYPPIRIGWPARRIARSHFHLFHFDKTNTSV